MMKFVFGKEENIVRKGQKCWLPYPYNIFESLFLRVIKRRHCEVKDKATSLAQSTQADRGRYCMQMHLAHRA